MDTERCRDCGELYWSDDSDSLCSECRERPDREANRQRAAEMWAAYIRDRQAKTHEGD